MLAPNNSGGMLAYPTERRKALRWLNQRQAIKKIQAAVSFRFGMSIRLNKADL